jgi:hypothetical protein
MQRHIIYSKYGVQIKTQKHSYQKLEGHSLCVLLSFLCIGVGQEVTM